MKLSTALRTLPHSLYVLLALAFVLSLAATLWMSYQSPVNADEIFWKMMISRFDTDKGKLVYLFAQCQNGQWLDAPITWYPAMVLHGFFYENASAPWILRIHGWILFTVLLMAWTWLLKRRSGLHGIDAFLGISASFCVGVMPFMMVYDRPEQPLLLLITLALLTTVFLSSPLPNSKTNWTRGTLLLLVFAFLAALLAGTHPKGLFLFPVLLVLAWRALKSPLLIGTLLGLMAWIAYDTQMIWQLRTHCPEFPGLMKVLQNLTLRPGLLLKDPAQFLQAGWANLLAFDAYINSLMFQTSYVSTWLPTANPAWNATSFSVLVANTLMSIPLVIAAVVTVSNWLSHRRPQTPTDMLLWLTLTLALAALVILQTAKNFYEASMIWPLILLVTIFSFGRPLRAPKAAHVRVLISILMVLAVLSGWVRQERFSGNLEQWQSERAAQIAQNSMFNQSLQTFAKQQCGIDDSAKRLILDKDSYQAFWQHEQPVFLDYAAGWWAAEADIEVTAKQRHVEGLVARCAQVPEALRARMQAGSGPIEGFCCIPAQQLVSPD